MENRFIKNRDTVKKIADSFGLVLFGFDPSWSFSLLKDAIIKEKPKETMKDVIEHRVPDDFMGKVAVFMGYEWEFAESMNDIEKEIKELKNSLNVLKREREKERKREREKERKREREKERKREREKEEVNKKIKTVFQDFEGFDTFSELIGDTEKSIREQKFKKTIRDGLS